MYRDPTKEREDLRCTKMPIIYSDTSAKDVTLLTNFSDNEDFFRCFSDSANECFSGCAR